MHKYNGDIVIGDYRIKQAHSKKHRPDGIWQSWNPIGQDEKYIIHAIDAICQSGFIAELATLSASGERLSVFFRDNRKRTYKIKVEMEIDREIGVQDIMVNLQRMGDIKLIQCDIEELSQD